MHIVALTCPALLTQLIMHITRKLFGVRGPSGDLLYGYDPINRKVTLSCTTPKRVHLWSRIGKYLKIQEREKKGESRITPR